MWSPIVTFTWSTTAVASDPIEGVRSQHQRHGGTGGRRHRNTSGQRNGDRELELNPFDGTKDRDISCPFGPQPWEFASMEA